MSQNPYYAEDEARIRKQVERRFKERQALWIHGTAFLVSNVMLWILWALIGGGFPWALIVTLSWSIGIAAHFLTYYNKYGGGAERREEAIQREIERYRERAAYEKPKNDFDSRLDITDDSEIEEVYDDSSQRQRR